MSTERPAATRAARSRTRRGRVFVITFAVVVAIFGVLALGGAAATVAQGPRVTSVQVDPAASVAASGSRLIVTTSQSLAPLDASQVTVSPATPFTVDTSGRSLGVRFSLPLHDETEYTLSFTDVEGLGGGPAASFDYSFTTPAIETYMLQRTSSGDTIFRTDLTGEEATPVFRGEHIEDFRATSNHLVVSVLTDGVAQLIVTDLDGGSPRELPLPGEGFVTSLQSADRGELIGYTYSDADLGAAGGIESGLYTASLKESEANTAPTKVTVTGAEPRVNQWRFVPDTDSILLITFDSSLLLTGSAGQNATALGAAISIDGTARGAGADSAAEAIVTRVDGVVVIDLADASETPLVESDTPLGRVSAALPVPGGGTIRTASPMDASGLPTGTTVAYVAEDGASRVLLDAASTDAVLQTCVSPSGRYAAVLVAPDAVNNSYDRYQLPLPAKMQTHVIEIADGSEVIVMSGFDISWCRVPVR